MKAKTTKFLAVLAVLVMAFAAVAVFSPADENDAADAKSVWNVPDDGTTPSFIKVGTDIVKPTDGQTLVDATAYYVDTDMTLNIDKKADLSNGAILIFLKEGVTLDVIRPAGCQKVVVYALFGVVESVNDAEETILTLHENYGANSTSKKLTTDTWVKDGTNTIQFPKTWATSTGDNVTGYDKTYHGSDSRSHNTFYEGWDLDGKNRMMWRTPQDVTVNVEGKISVHGSFVALEYYGPMSDPVPATADAVWTFQDASGVIGSWRSPESPSANTISLDNFTGIIHMYKTGDAATEIPVIERWDSGNITVTKGSVKLNTDDNTTTGVDETVYLPEESSITFANGVIVGQGWTVPYKRFVYDVYSFTTTAGSFRADDGGFTITAGDNGLELSGSAVLKAASEWTFSGAAKVSGIINMDSKTLAFKWNTANNGYQTTLEDLRMDNVGGFSFEDVVVCEGQVTVNGDVVAGANLIVAPSAYVNISGSVSFGASVFIGKDATLRASLAYIGGGNPVPYDDTKWTTKAFVDRTGAFFLNQNKVTTTSAAVVSYLNQIGAGQVSINSSICTKNSTYYQYKQVIPYLSLNPVDVICTSPIAKKATISLDGISHTETPVPIGNQARYTIDYATGVPEFTVVFTELFPVEIQNAYDSLGAEIIEVIDENGEKVFMEPKSGATTTGIVKLAYGHEYTIKGVNTKNKYTFYYDGAAGAEGVEKLDPVSLFSASFTMVRGYLGATTSVVVVPAQVHYITYAVGYATQLTIILDDSTSSQFKEGDVFIYFTTEVDEDGKPIGEGTPVVVELDSSNQEVGVIRAGVYSTDTVFFMSEYRQFYKLTPIPSSASKVVFPAAPAGQDLDFETDKWSLGYTFDGITESANKASFKVKCDLDTVEITFDLTALTSETGKKVHVNFSTYCSRASHAQEVDSPFDNNKIVMCVGEEYEITWDPIDGKFMDMTFVKTGVEGDEDKPYTEGTTVVASPVALTYKLTVTPIYYMTVINNTGYDLTVSIGEFRADIGADDKNEKVIVNDGKGNAVVLSKKGYTVNNWTFDLKNAEKTHEYVSGTMTTKALISKDADPNAGIPAIVGYYSAFPTTADIQATFVMTITNAQVTPITYTVDVEADDHATITNYDNSGQLGQLRKAYVQPWQEYDVIAVEYEYQEIDMAQKAVGQAEKKTSPETGQEYWEYVMPASNVLLKPIVQKETRNLSFVDETGATIAETQKVEPRTTVNEPVPCKPLYKIVEVTTEPTVEGFKYDPATGYMTFTMPDADVKVIVTCEEIQYSEKLLVTVGQEKSGADINVVLYALDGKAVGPGEVTIEVWYTYINEFGDVSVDYVDVTLTYEANDQTVAVLTDDTFIEELAENYNGAYAITGSYTFGTVEGELSTTEYKPVEA